MLKTKTPTTPLKLLVRVLQDVVRREQFATYADLSEALKLRCGRLKIRYDSQLVSAAIEQLEQGGRYHLVPRVEVQRTSRREQLPEGPVLNRFEASDIYQRLQARYLAEHPGEKTTPDWPEHFPYLVEVPR